MPITLLIELCLLLPLLSCIIPIHILLLPVIVSSDTVCACDQGQVLGSVGASRKRALHMWQAIDTARDLKWLRFSFLQVLPNGPIFCDFQ